MRVAFLSAGVSLLALAACGDAATRRHGPGDPTIPPSAKALVRRAGGAASVVHLWPDEGQIAPFSARLPFAASEAGRVWDRGDRVAIEQLAPDRHVLWIGDEAGWTATADLPAETTHLQISDNLALMAVIDRSASSTYTCSLRSEDGKVLAAVPGPLCFAAAAPEGTYGALRSEDGVLLVFRDGSRRGPIAAESLVRLMATSLLVGNEGRPTWLDLEARELEVAGFSGEPDALLESQPGAGRWARTETGVARVEDRLLVPVVAGAVEGRWVLGELPGGGLVVRRDDGTLAVVRPDGSVEAYEPGPARPALPFGAWNEIDVFFFSRSAAAPDRLLLRRTYELQTGDVWTSLGAVDEVWFPGETSRPIVRAYDQDQLMRERTVGERLFTPGGRLVWIEGGALQRLDLESGSRKRIDTGEELARIWASPSEER